MLPQLRVFRLYVCLSVTLVHPAKDVGRNEMPFRRDICLVPSNTVLDRSPAPPPREVEIWGSEPPVHSDAAYRQITLAVVYSYNDIDCYETYTGWAKSLYSPEFINCFVI